jgi:hypothetical protein
MKLILIASLFSTLAFADGVTISSDGKTATTLGMLKSTSSEMLEVLNDAHDEGYKDSRGADIFTKTSINQGTHKALKLANKKLTASMTSGITVSYSTVIKVKKKEELSLSSDKKTLTITGDTAKLLMGALELVIQTPQGPLPLGSTTRATKSGKISCKLVVYRGMPTTCTIKL